MTKKNQREHLYKKAVYDGQSLGTFAQMKLDDGKGYVQHIDGDHRIDII